MKKDITIVGTIDEEKGEIKISKHGLDVPHLIMTINELTKALNEECFLLSKKIKKSQKIY